METTMAVMMALGIFVAIPAIIGAATVTVFMVKEYRGWKAGNTTIKGKTRELEKVA